MEVAIGIDVGGTKILACAIDRSGKVLSEVKASTEPTKVATIDVLCAVVRESLDQLGEHRRSVRGVGLGLPGLIDASGVLHQTPNLRVLEETNIREEIGVRLFEVVHSESGALDEIGFASENDATAAAGGEFAFGAARGASDAVIVTLGTGIGGGLIVNGRIARGAAGFAGEVGHMVIDVGGADCVCGRAGCFEQYASGTGIARLAREAIANDPKSAILEIAGGDLRAVRAEHVVTAASNGDSLARDILDDASSYLAIGLGNLAEILDPARIVVGGGLVAASQYVIEPAIAKMPAMRRGRGPNAVDVVLAELGPRAGAIGVAALSLGVIE